MTQMMIKRCLDDVTVDGFSSTTSKLMKHHDAKKRSIEIEGLIEDAGQCSRIQIS